MANSKRNQQDPSREEQPSDASLGQRGETQNAGAGQDENPQRGDGWNNYQTRELSGGEESGENFYRNRERGNYEEGPGSGDEGGGTLY